MQVYCMGVATTGRSPIYTGTDIPIPPPLPGQAPSSTEPPAGDPRTEPEGPRSDRPALSPCPSTPPGPPFLAIRREEKRKNVEESSSSLPSSPLEALLRDLRRRLRRRRLRVGIHEPAARLALLELDARALARADADARPARAAADGAPRAARGRVAVCVVDAAACGA